MLLLRFCVKDQRVRVCVCVVQDERVKELAQDLAERLDLKTRKAYVGIQVSTVGAF